MAVLSLTWYLYDSIYLRYVLLFFGVASSTYAIRDAWEQGILSQKTRGQVGCSDFEKMAEEYNKCLPVSNTSSRIFHYHSLDAS